MPSILINTDQGATVTISKDGTSRQLVATNGTALFEDVEYGTWNVSAALDGATTTDTIEVINEFGLTLSIGQKLSSMPLKTTKLKIGGIKWILFTRDHAGYPSGAQTLISEYALERIRFGSTVNYGDSNVKSACETKYQAFGEHEKKYVLETIRKIFNDSAQYLEVTEHMFILNSTEVGCTSDSKMGSNIGFTGNADRICRTEGGATQTWWLADAYSASRVSYVASAGSLAYEYPSFMSYVRPAMNLSSNTIITTEPDSEGYYTIKGAEETTELLLSRALNALSNLGVKQ